MDLESPKFSKQVSFGRDKASKIQRVITLAIAIGITLGCTPPLRSAQTEVVSTDYLVFNDSEPFTVSEDLPISPDPITSILSPSETQVAQSEVEMMRLEALETAISDENFTRLKLEMQSFRDFPKKSSALELWENWESPPS